MCVSPFFQGDIQMFSIDGIVSGFDTSSIIESLLGFQETQLETYNSRKAEITTQQSAFKGIEAQMLSLRNTLGRLNRSGSASVFDVQSATSSDEDIVNVAASSNAANGSYNLTINSLAAAHQIGSQGYESTNAEVSTGEITLKVGDNPATTLTIDETNNTLAGLANSINEQVDDVSASIIYDQGSDSHRLLLTSNETGLANEITVTGEFRGGTGTEPDFSGLAIQEAADAVITLGSGPGAITATYSTNQVEDLIENVSLNLESADPTKTVTINVSSDSESAKEAIRSFVDEFNTIMSFIDDQTRYLPETGQASPLLGNRSVNEMQARLRSFVIDAVPGLEGGSNRLASIGIDINAQGKLQLDEGKLDKAFNGQIEGVDPSEIRNLFGLNGNSNNVGVEFLAGGTRTLATGDTPYEVQITQVATQATIFGSSLNGTTTIDGSNNEFQITLDGIVSETLTLEEGDYTSEELAQHVQSLINNSDELGVHNVEVSIDADKNALVITSEQYGANSSIASISGSASSALGFTGTESDNGQNVEGYFLVDGVREEATGSGRVLIGDSENENTADLQVRVSLTEDQLSLNSEAEISVTRGISGQLDQYLDDILDTDNGALKNIDDDFEARIQSIDDSISRVQDITDSKREYLIQEFTALESILNELQTTGSFLTSQLAALSPQSSSNN